MLTDKGRMTAILIRVRDRWPELTPSQQAECSEILQRLRVALGSANAASPSHAGVTRQPAKAASHVRAGGNVRVPLLGRIVV